MTDNSEKLRLLVIEDDQDQCELIVETLESHFGEGTTEGVRCGAEALKRDLTLYDLILSDFNLPDYTGMKLLEIIRTRSKTPVIMVTGENVGQFAAEAIRRGAMDYVVKFGDYLLTIPLVVEKNLTVANIMRRNEQLSLELERAIREVRDKNLQLEQSLLKLEELAATDPLTGLYNRRHFSRVLDQLFAESERMDSDMSCVMIDLDGYKKLNDGYGHAMGDQLLAIAGRVISANMRRMDVAARYGGDEFVLLLPHATAEEALRVAQRIRDEFRQGSAIALRNNQGVTMSIGVAARRGSRASGSQQLVAMSDAALYRAKAEGRDRAVAHAKAEHVPG
jgi:diguanylate cyclase (GGDEF)-like protein